MKSQSATLLASALLAIVGDTDLLAQNVNTIIAPTGAPPSGMSKVDLSAVTVQPNSPGLLLATNARMIANGSTLADYWVGLYGVSNTTGGLSLLKADKYPSVGVYYEDEVLFMRDLASLGALKMGSTAAAWDSFLAYKSAVPVTATLEQGSSISVTVQLPSTASYALEVKDSAGRVIYDFPGTYDGSTMFWPVAILRQDTYAFRIKPLSATSMTAKVRFTHANGTKTQNLVSGGTFNFTLPAYSLSYAKAKIRVTGGYSIRLNMTAGSAVDPRVVDSTGNLIYSDGNLKAGLTYTTPPMPATGDYYLVIRKPETSAAMTSAATSKGTITLVK